MASLQVPAASAPQILRKNGDVLSPTAIQDLKSRIKSEVLVKGETSEDAYRAAIHRWNEAYITEASIIVFCESEEDVAQCLHFIQEWNLDLVVAGGRHSYSGASSGTGLVIDLRKMRKVVINKANMTATAQGGCLAMDIEQPADAEGLSAVFGAVNDTGIAGITMGGGTGPFTGRYGTICDNLLAARIVLADGRILLASEKENSELFWAIRGCGPNFGVVTEFTYKLHWQEGPVFHGIFAFSPDKLESFLALINPLYETVTKCEGKLLVMAAFAALPGSQRVSPLCLVFYDGPEEEARPYTASLLDLGPIMNQCSMKRYPEVTEVSPMMAGPPSHQRYACKSVQLVPPMDTESIKGFIEDFRAFMAKYGPSVDPSKIALELRYSGVTSSVPVDAMAYAARRKACIIIVDAQYDDASLDKTIRSEAKVMIEKLKERLIKNSRHGDESAFVLNANLGTGDEKAQSVFGENLPRLKSLKKKYDPEFIFDKWFPIKPE